ncbi:hypothetical protein K1T71_007345 [Dendrolimus kikuchii]|uniref:Uncharacterized protein n=1 Tax=Dendrolimus kikuchii TaxID=765133 RepID=A0ACC1D0H2_9NEOP|nr:hypothetical protein K1T71_007345 [Dendrolimus kikuchii]
MKHPSNRVILVFLSLSLFVLFIYTLKGDIKIEDPLKVHDTIPINNKTISKDLAKENQESSVKDDKNKEHELPMKYILQWTSARNVPFVYMGVGQKTFIEKKCPYTNCFVTADRKYLGDYTKFDVIAFSGTEVIHMNRERLPAKRAPHQKYTFTNIESADNYPVCSNRFNRYFNWTWTFRLDSEVRWGYMTIRDKYKNIVGPNKIMQWMKLEDMDPVTEEFKEKLKTKSKAAAWFVSNCYTRSNRAAYVRELQKELKKYNLEIDIYGHCGTKQCSRDNEDACDSLIKEKYYFYLSFENSFDEDYVTEKLLHALNYNAIPIVYGGANYTRFMPDGIYLNAKQMNVKDLAMRMHELIQSPEEYAQYFKWKNHYSYHRKVESPETDEYCLFCTILNDEEKVKKTTVYEDFQSWWDPPGRC